MRSITIPMLLLKSLERGGRNGSEVKEIPTTENSRVICQCESSGGEEGTSEVVKR
jgi:hypothetical protein